MAVTFPVLSYKLTWEMPWGIHHSKFVSFSISLLLCLGVSGNEPMIRNLFLTLEVTVESAAKAIAAPKKYLHSVVTVILDSMIALDYLLAKQGGVCAMVTTTWCTWIDNFGEIETQLHKKADQATWLKKVTSSMGALFDFFDSDWFSSWGSWLQSTLQTLGIIMLRLSDTIAFFQSFKCMFAVTSHWVISLGMQCQKKEQREWLT